MKASSKKEDLYIYIFCCYPISNLKTVFSRRWLIYPGWEPTCRIDTSSGCAESPLQWSDLGSSGVSCLSTIKTPPARHPRLGSISTSRTHSWMNRLHPKPPDSCLYCFTRRSNGSLLCRLIDHFGPWWRLLARTAVAIISTTCRESQRSFFW